MRKLLALLTLVAFVAVPLAQAGDEKAPAKDKSACCQKAKTDTAALGCCAQKTTAEKGTCPAKSGTCPVKGELTKKPVGKGKPSSEVVKK